MLVLPKVDEPTGLNGYPVLYWNHVGLEMNRITHSLGGPQGGPTMSSRALGLLHLAMHDAFFTALGNNQASTVPNYLPDVVVGSIVAKVQDTTGTVPIKPADLDNADAALTAAAITILDRLYARPGPAVSIVASDTLTGTLGKLIADYPTHIDSLSAAHGLGVGIADEIFNRLAVKPGEIGADQGRFEPGWERYNFRDEPVTPVRQVFIDPNDPSRGVRARHIYHGPYYGITVADFAVTDPDGHKIAPWPKPATPHAAGEYLDALKEVVRLGGAPGLSTTERSSDQTVAAYYWAYDGANLIGTPPRLYNQILREIAWGSKLPVIGPGPAAIAAEELARTGDFVRLFALANTAMADAGKFAWREKYRYQLWRPLSGVREHDTGSDYDSSGTPELNVDADPFWLTLGAPETNTNRVSFKPPFPAYPSGHATFGAAAFQMARLFYKERDGTNWDDNGPDSIAFSFVSDELNGVSRDLRQPFNPEMPIEDQEGIVRTRVKRSFTSLWQAIFENAFSRIYLGIHWRFDAAAATDMIDSTTGQYKDADTIEYSNVWIAARAPGETLPTGGVPLGLGIANDIFGNKMKAPLTAQSAMQSAEPVAKISNTTYR
ncbi:vanadium-dependent haloperoxidase [Rhizobium laguerreae]|uniref:vanadium-dependent haloperoxidase n=1 Tax=Rhizobium laguerreae TaxID=1076926 RepID=UPI001C917F35|nr:vanadium-dependent haloperoxidase [Rhizobium laguerreae]MBY3182246.1 vanadium-dependent haloperoxidase [Rhizobium laguerreae]